MAQIFSRGANRLPLILVLWVLLSLLAIVGFSWYYGSLNYTDVGYRPVQPVAYSHKLHAGDLGLDCHRNPDEHLRPPEEVTNMYWTPPADQAKIVARFKEERKIDPPENCSACHR